MVGIAGVVVLVASSACAQSPSSKTAAKADAPWQTADFTALVAAAKASDHKVRQALSSETPKTIEERQKAFEKRFGFPLVLEKEPGHLSLDMPPKIIQSAASKRGVVDVSTASAVNFAPVFEQGLMHKPNWAAVESQWPIIKELRKFDLGIKNKAGEQFSDYCMLHAQTPWLPVVNTNKINPKDLEGFAWEDLTDPKWKNRLVLDGNAIGLYVFPFAPGWDEARLTKFTKGLGANKPTITSGGSTGVSQALLQGEGDIGMVVFSVADRLIQDGAPLAHVLPKDFVPVDTALACLINPGVNDPAMSQLYLAWFNAERVYEETGAVRFGTGEEKHFKMAQIAASFGVEGEEIVHPRTLEDDKATANYRVIAKKGITGG